MRKILPIFVSVFFASCAQANFSDLYTSVNAGGSYFTNLSSNGESFHGFSGPALSIFLGAPANQYFAPELALEYDRASTFGSAVLAGLDIKLMAPVKQDFLLFIKAGAGLGEITTKNGGTNTEDQAVTLFGAGAGYRFLPLWMGTVEFNGAYFDSTKKVIGGVTLGITRFWQW